ncbi:MAG: T9SS type A sorting domain-containing protein, partial [Bacteroidota bacterium]
TVGTRYDCTCTKPVSMLNNISTSSRYHPTIRSFTVNDRSCLKTAFHLNVSLLVEEIAIEYNYSWEMHFEHQHLDFGAENCSDQLTIHFIPDQDYPERFVSSDGRLTLRIGENQLIVEATAEHTTILSTKLHTCCKAKNERSPTKLLTQNASADPLPAALDAFQVVPNPTDGHLKIRVQLPSATPLQLRLQSPQGQLLKSWRFPANSPGQQEWQTDLSHFPPGFYYLSIQTNSMQATQKVVLLH